MDTLVVSILFISQTMAAINKLMHAVFLVCTDVTTGQSLRNELVVSFKIWQIQVALRAGCTD